MYKEKIIDVKTGKETYRDYNEAEIAEILSGQAEAAERVKASQEREAKRQSALNKLIDLGLTEEEIAAL